MFQLQYQEVFEIGMWTLRDTGLREVHDVVLCHSGILLASYGTCFIRKQPAIRRIIR